MKNFFKVSMVALMAAVTLTSCCMKNAEKNAELISVSCTPAVLSLKGDKVDAQYTVNVPKKFFNKDAIVKATPVLIYDGGEVAGTPKFFQGEDVKDNYQVVAYKTESTVTGDVSFTYKPEYKRSTLVLRLEISCDGDIQTLEPVGEDYAVAEGIGTVQQLSDNFAKLAYSKDNFKRVTVISENADLMYKINSSVVSKDQLNSEDIATLENFIKENTGVERKTLSDVYSKSYASPDGPLDQNDELAVKRAKSTEKALTEKFKKNETPAKAFQFDALGEDWEGFKELVQESDIEQKDLILQILAMTSDPEKRDAEIKNLSVVFEVLADKILPELRRSKLQVDMQVEGLTDAELKAAVNNDVNSLKLEELLYAATLFEDNETKAKAYKAATSNFADCYRGWNNYGVAMAKMGKINDAKSAFAKAASLNHSADEVINNLGVVAIFEGDNAEAKKYFSSISTEESKYNMGLVSLSEGDYAVASKSLEGYNLAVAEYCNGNVAKAKSILANGTSAQELYLKAIISANEGDKAATLSALTAAIAKDSSLKDAAADEVYFSEFAEDAAFKALLK